MHLFTATSQNATKVTVKELYKHRYAYTHRYTYTLILRNIHTDTDIGVASHRLGENVQNVHI